LPDARQIVRVPVIYREAITAGCKARQPLQQRRKFGELIFDSCGGRANLVGKLILSGGFKMEWTTPQHEEIDLNCEISSYANAEL
jgi:hypothetical protein